jgi:hypothetical protein
MLSCNPMDCILFISNPPDDDIPRSKHVVVQYNQNKINTDIIINLILSGLIFYC